MHNLPYPLRLFYIEPDDDSVVGNSVIDLVIDHNLVRGILLFFKRKCFEIEPVDKS